jgi:hypothetical protein
MDTITSSEFRRRYASLTSPTIVTVNGHAIGTYQPISAAIDSRAAEGIRPGEPHTPVGSSSFNSRPFTPVPKSGRR